MNNGEVIAKSERPSARCARYFFQATERAGAASWERPSPSSAAPTMYICDRAWICARRDPGRVINVFVERLRRSVKYEEVYLRAYDSVGEARASIGRYL